MFRFKWIRPSTKNYCSTPSSNIWKAFLSMSNSKWWESYSKRTGCAKSLLFMRSLWTYEFWIYELQCHPLSAFMKYFRASSGIWHEQRSFKSWLLLRKQGRNVSEAAHWLQVRDSHLLWWGQRKRNHWVQMRIRRLWEVAPKALEPTWPCSYAWRSEAISLSMVRKGVHSKGKSKETCKTTCKSRRER